MEIDLTIQGDEELLELYKQLYARSLIDASLYGHFKKVENEILRRMKGE